MSEPARPGPLSGLLVADFSRVLAGPYCTMLLADLGADVIKVESPGGDDTRSWVPPVTEDGVSTYFLAINRNKRSVALDLKDDGDRALAQELARRADVFVQNFKPGGLARFGLDYDAVSAVNPSIIYASISGFGSGGGKDLPGYDLMVQAMSGLMSLTGDPEGPPYRAGISAFDVIAGLHTTIAILAALNHRNATGEGQHLDASLMASAMSGMVNQTSAYAAGGAVPFRMGNSHPSLFPYEPLPTGDGDLIVTAGNDAQFRKLCEVIGAPELPDGPAVRDQPRPDRQPRHPAAAARRQARGQVGGRLVRRADRGRRALRADQHRGQGGRVRREDRPRADRHRGDGREVPADDAAPGDLLQDPGQLPARAAGTRRAGRGDPRVVGAVSPIGDGGPIMTEYPTSLGTSDADTITLLGQDLAEDLMGKVGFGELTLWMVTQRRPTPAEVRVFESVLVALADHGFTPTAIAARLTYLSAPDSLQGAIAAGILGGGSRFLGVTEDCGQYLAAVLAEAGEIPADDAGFDALALEAVKQARAAKKFVPGLGHPVHKVRDPRTPRLIQIATEEGLRGPHLRLFEAIGRVHPQVLGRTLPLNGAGRLRRGPRRPRPAARHAARVRAARQDRGAPRPARGGAADADRERHLHARGPQRHVRGTEVRVIPLH